MANTIEKLKTVTSMAELKKLSPSFQEAYGALQEISSFMSSSDLSVEISMTYYKSAKFLHKYCEDILNKAKEELEEVIVK